MITARCFSTYATLLLTIILLLPHTSIASQDDDNHTKTVAQQLEVASKLGTVNQDFNMEESGIIGLDERAGLSLGLKYYLELVDKYQVQLKNDKENISLWLGLAQAWEMLKQDNKALEAYQQALKISKSNAIAKQGIIRIHKKRQLQIRTYWSSMTEDQHSPEIQKNFASWQEQVKQIQVTKSWGEGKTIGIGWLDSTIRQDNLIYDDIDFSLHRQGPFFMLSWPVMNRLSTSLRVRDERFSNDDDNVFYQLEETKHIITGHFLINYKGDGFWTALNYSKNRDTDPIYDLLNDRALLYIESKELIGISYGTTLMPRVEIGSSIYYEQYSYSSLNQFNPNLQINYWPSIVPGFQLSLGSGYYTEEVETIVNLTSKYQWQPWSHLQLQLEYQLEYSASEDSWLNQGDILINWSITKQLSINLQTQYGAENGGDKDTFFFTQGSLNWDFL